MEIQPFAVIVIIVYAFASVSLLLFGLNAYVMLTLRFTRFKSKKSASPPQWDENDPDSIPFVTVQLPIYNERNVADRAIRCAAVLDWHPDRLEIQVLDDSTDETVDIVNHVVAELKARGILIDVIRRPNRDGYKAGALAYGTDRAKGDYFAIFDADFTPQPDTLIRLMPEFTADEKIGFVQARWGHLNRNENFLTRCQALGIDGHFLVEQPARFASGLLMNFNGTAGIWSREAIQAAGGWKADTLTEDLDLSYRVQIAGYKPRYRADVIVPAEIPATISAAKSQQFRWAKGSIQTAIKILPKVFKKKYSLFTKLQAFAHLSNYAVHPLMLTLSILAFPIIALFKIQVPPQFWFWAIIPLLAATFGPSTMYSVAVCIDAKNNLKCLLWLPVLVIYGTGIAISNTKAVLEAIFGWDSAFIRTPKKGEKNSSGYKLRKNRIWIIEIFIGIYSIGSIIASIENNQPGILPFVTIFALGFLLVGLTTLREVGGEA